MFSKSSLVAIALSLLSASEQTVALPIAHRAAAATGAADFGSCTTPQIEFGVGFDNRKETSFQPVDKTSYNHGSAQAIGIITQFMCDTLTNTCGANQAAKDTCAQAQTAAAAAPPKTGADADAFNAVFGIQTNFASVTAIDDTGNPIAGSATGSGAAAASGTAAAATATTSAAAGNNAAAATTSAAAAASSTAAATGAADFGSCTTPQIEFGAGFDNRKETSFQPVDKTSFNHGSAQAIGIISQFICDTLTNSCKANQAAKDTCAQAQTAAAAAPPKTGADADAFNAVFGIQTNFASVTALDDQGNPIAGSATGSGAAASGTAATATASVPSGNNAAVATTSAAAAASGTAAATGAADFGSCTTPQIEFGVGFDNRKETSFQPVDKTSFNHGSAQAIGIISQFICDTLTNSCKANQAAKDTCAQAQTAAAAAPPKTGADADAFNAVFGIQTNFASVTAIDDQGNPIAGSATGSGAAAASGTAAAATATTSAASGNNAAAATTTSAAAASTSSAAASSCGSVGDNLQTFTGSLGVSAPAVTATADGQFAVAGNASFNNEQNALVRSCDVQHNACANAANASGNKGSLTVSACGDQQTQCNAAASA
ncbi:hypothetical protein PLICRDRAFT_174793 [Plicaturopsis crispa FD-325 SS-3]|nr:hypothetical protein PLICRDRAFT_174793 [Plicaturopsis crispa FD-325 SS-3]